MDEHVLLVDIDRCVSCHSCEVACKQEHSLPVGPKWAEIVTIGPRTIGGRLHADYVFTTCLQCEDPACVNVCPSGAFETRSGIAYSINQSNCTGCGYCVAACPYGAVLMDPERGKAWKCSLCEDRIERGLPPSCVQHCAGGALQLTSTENLATMVDGRHIARKGRICYASTKWELLL